MAGRKKPLPAAMHDAQRLLDRVAAEGLLILRPASAIRQEAVRRAEARLLSALESKDYFKIEKAISIDVEAMVDEELVVRPATPDHQHSYEGAGDG